MKDLDAIQIAIANSDLDEAFRLIRLKGPSFPDVLEQVISLESQYSSLKKDQDLGVISFENEQLTRNKIVRGLQGLLADIPVTGNKNSSSGENSSSSESISERLARDREFAFHPQFLNHKIEELYIGAPFSYHRTNFSLFNVAKEPKSTEYREFINLEKLSIDQYLLEYFIQQKKYEDARNKPPRCAMVIGFPGQGKTSLCYKLQSRLNSENKEFKYYDLADSNYQIFSLAQVLSSLNQNCRVLILDGITGVFNTREKAEGLLKEVEIVLKNHEDLKIIITVKPLSFFYPAYNNKMVWLRLESFDIENQKLWLQTVGRQFSEYPEAVLIELETISEGESSRLSFLEALTGVPGVLAIYLKIVEQYQMQDAGYELLKFFLDELLEPVWRDSKRPESFNEIDQTVFYELCQLISGVIFQSIGQRLSLFEILEHEKNKRLIREKKISGFERFLPDLASLLYLQAELDISNNHLTAISELKITFFGKKLMEWLYVDSFLNEVKQIKHYDDSKPEFNREALEVICRLFIHYPITDQIDLNISRERYDLSRVNLKNIGGRLIDYLPYFLKYQLIHDTNFNIPSPPPIEKCIHGFYRFWRFLKITRPDQPIIESSAVVDFVQLFRIAKAITDYSFDLSFQTLHEADFSNLKIGSGDVFANSDLSKARFKRTHIQGVNFSSAKMTETDFTGAFIEESNFSEANGEGSVWTDAKVVGGNFTKSKFQSAHLEGVSLEGNILEEVNFERASFNNAQLQNAILIEVNFKDADLEAINLKGSTLDAVNFERSTLNNANLYGTEFKDLKGLTNFSDALLKNADLSSLKRVIFLDGETSKVRLGDQLMLDMIIKKAGSLIDAKYLNDENEAENLSTSEKWKEIRETYPDKFIEMIEEQYSSEEE